MAKTSNKKALLASVLAMVLCVSMLIGTTFAWFTDTVSSTNNIIKSGRLDVELEYSTDAVSWTPVTDKTNIFKEGALWEPGYTEVIYLKVSNKGNLALKYQLGVNIASEVASTNVNGNDFKLSDYIYYGIIDGSNTYTRDTAIAAVSDKAKKISVGYVNESTLNTNGDADIVTMIVYMPTTVNNDANYMEGANVPTINLGVNLYATQFTYEYDSFGTNDYDEDAEYSNAIYVSNTTELIEALSNVDINGSIILDEGTYTLTADMQMGLSTRGITLKGAGVDKTIIDAATYATNGMAALYVGTDNITVRDMTIKTSSTNGDVAGIKVSAWNGEYTDPENVTLKNLKVVGSAGHGINIHGANDVVVDNVDIVSYAKCGIAIAKATGVVITNSSTVAGGWADIGCMYSSNEGNIYNTPSSFTFDDTNDFGNKAIYSERPETATGGKDTANVPSDWTKAETAAGWVYLGPLTVSNATDLQAALTRGGVTYLASDIAVNSTLNMKANGILDGKGFKLVQGDGLGDAHALIYVDDPNSDAMTATIKNVVFDGITAQSAVRTVGVDLVLDSCTFKNCSTTNAEGIVRLNIGSATVKNCVFEGNSAPMGVSFNYDAGNATDVFTAENNMFKNNTFTSTAAVYYVQGASCTVNGNSFIGNSVSSAGTDASSKDGNCAIVYLGFKANCTVTNNLFESNSATSLDNSLRVGGAIMVGNQATISGNAFIGNTSANVNGALGGSVCASVYYSDIDLSGNYWGSSAPVENTDYHIEYPENNDVIINSFEASYTVDADGVGVTVA